ncbi:MAG TPA: phage holin family protein [Bryobacteraceae bacterium]|nr:phage holin family protein [Bryobacteraceae bacterium]
MADELGIVEPRRTTSTILRDIIRDIEQIIRAEVELAKTEMREKVRTAGEASGWLGAAAGLGLLAGACVVMTVIVALALILPLWLAALIMAVVLGAIAGALFLHGLDRIKRAQPVLPETTGTLKENAEWLKRQAS